VFSEIRFRRWWQ